LSAVRQQVLDLDAELVFIGSGSPEQAGWFVEDFSIEAPAYSDESLAAYRALETRRGLLSSIHPRVLLRSARALLGGFRQTATQGPVLQQGGVWILLPGDEVAYSHRSSYAGDHPSPDDILHALARLRRERCVTTVSSPAAGTRLRDWRA